MQALQKHVVMEHENSQDQNLENGSSQENHEVTVPRGKYPTLADLLKEPEVIEILDTDDEGVLDMEVNENGKETISMLSDEDDEMEEATDGSCPSTAINIE